MARRRSVSVFNLAFLDIMSCGFGAVVLVFLIIKHSTSVYADEINETLLAETNRVEVDVRDGQADLVRLRQALEAALERISSNDAEAATVAAELELEAEALRELLETTAARRESIEQLRSDVDELEETYARLPSNRFGAQQVGSAAREFAGEGYRQYLTGLQVGGQRILILLDRSASMLDETLVNVIRRRNMAPERMRAAPKWRRAVGTVEWLASQLPLDSQFQLYTFSEDTAPVLADTAGTWIDVDDRARLDAVVNAVGEVVPGGGTSLIRAFRAINDLTPRPDNILLITDGLPTLGDGPSRSRTVSGNQRAALFREAVRELPRGVPVNVILMPLEGDPFAAPEYWELAVSTQGSFLTPSRDWP